MLINLTNNTTESKNHKNAETLESMLGDVFAETGGFAINS